MSAANPALSMINLCDISYDYADAIPNDVKCFNPKLEVVWGPVEYIPSGCQSVSLIYIVRGPIVTVSADEYTVVIRGTNYLSWQSWRDEDFDIGESVDFRTLVPCAPEGAVISRGTHTAMGYLINNSNDNGVSPDAFLQSVGPAKISQLNVTGHSLGGTLTPVYFTYLCYRLFGGSPVDNTTVKTVCQPFSFAGLTPGNAIFNSYFQEYIPSSLGWRYVNPLDAAPNCWWSLDGIRNLYAGFNLSIGWAENEFFGDLFREIPASPENYAQPTGGKVILPVLFNSDYPWDDDSWAGQAVFQHHSSTYITLVSMLSETPILPRRGSMISRLLNYLLNKIIWFGSTTETVTHEAHFSVSAKDAFKICKNYAEFIKVMLRNQPYPPNPWWKKGGPGEVGGQVSYFLDRDGSINAIVEQVSELAEDDKTGTYTLAWEQLSSKPQLPLRGYGCTWVLNPAGPNAEFPCCHLVWTRHFKQPLLFGVISLTGYMKGSFQRSAGPIMDEVFRQYYAAMFPPPNRRLPKPTDRVVVVGAGPSGLHMAHLLRREVGVKDITILERSGRHGGKTLTVKDSTQPGIVHELGTCYLHPAYFAVRSLIKELRQILGSRAGDFGAEVAPIHYSITRLGKGGDLSLEEWVIANLQVQPRWSPLALFRILFPKPDTVVELLAAKDTYNRLHEQYLGRYDYSMPPRPSAEVLAEIDMSFGQYLENHGLSALLPILAYGQTAQGYGSIENTPAFWAMCWITPQLLDGYFSMMPGALPKKAMFRHGWETLWDTIIKVNEFEVRYNTSIIGIERPDDAPIVITMTESGDGVVKREEFDYLVVAAPLVNPDPGGKAVPLDLRPNEKKLLGGANTSSSQFRTNLYKLKRPEPYLYAHLNLDADRVLGPGTGQGDVFASRDSYLALNPEYCTFEGHQMDPVRGELREQMSYQWVENDKHLPLEDLDTKFHEWAVERFGSHDNYERLQHKTWTYFQRFDRQGLALQAPWNVLELQGRNRTLYVHASNFFESVLDIVNYNNMLVDGLSGKLNELRHPISDTKPLYYQTEYWKIVYNKLTKYFLVFLDIVLGTIWTVLYAITRPILAVTLVRWLRYRLQEAFKTENPGPWWQHTMSHFIKVSPSVICFLNGKEDPVVTASKETLRKEHPEIPIVDKAVRWSYHDYRTAIRVWMNVIQPNFLTFITPGMMSLLRRFRSAFPVMYNYLVSWSFCVSFNPLTGYSVRVEDDHGGGCYVPKCQFLATAKKEYGDVVGSRICTHVCKIFTEEAMKMRGIDCTLEPRQEDGSCMIRGVPYQWPAYADHTVDCKLTIPGGTGSALPVVSSRS